jgi:hypothetical protein
MIEQETTKAVRLEITKNTKGYTYSAKVTCDTMEELQQKMGDLLAYADAKITQLNIRDGL